MITPKGGKVSTGKLSPAMQKEVLYHTLDALVQPIPI